MNKDLECKNVSPLLVGYIKSELSETEETQVEKHLAICPLCQGIKETLEMVSHDSQTPQLDLWPTLRSRLTGFEENEIPFRFPPLTWQVALSLAIIILTLLAVPNSWRILAGLGLL